MHNQLTFVLLFIVSRSFSSDLNITHDSIESICGSISNYIYDPKIGEKTSREDRYVEIQYPINDGKYENYYFPELSDKIKKTIANYESNKGAYFNKIKAIQLDSVLLTYKFIFITDSSTYVITPFQTTVSISLNEDYIPVNFNKTLILKGYTTLPQWGEGFVCFSMNKLKFNSISKVENLCVDTSSFPDTLNNVVKDRLNNKFLFAGKKLLFSSRHEKPTMSKSFEITINNEKLIALSFDTETCFYRRLFVNRLDSIYMKYSTDGCDP